MDANYVINRLKNTRYKYHTAQVLQERVENLDYFNKMQLVSNLKMMLCKESNLDIYEAICLVMQRRSSAA